VRLNQGFDHVSDKLQRVAPQEGESCFQQVGEIDKLAWSGIVNCHRPVMPLLCCSKCGRGQKMADSVSVDQEPKMSGTEVADTCSLSDLFMTNAVCLVGQAKKHVYLMLNRSLHLQKGPAATA
jgi:hypothetical protein